MIISRLLCLALVAVLAFPPVFGRPTLDLRGLEIAPVAQAAPDQVDEILPGHEQDAGRAGKRASRSQDKRGAKSANQKDKKSRQGKKTRKNQQNTQGKSAKAASTDTGSNDMTAMESAMGDDADCGPGLVPIPGTGRCTHGPDPEPPGVARELVRGVPSENEVQQETAGISCQGDGQSGYRVQVIYAYDVSRGSQFDQVVGNIRITAAGADDLMRESSIAAGEEMHFLFVHDSQCNIDVQPVGFTTAQMQNFGTMIQAMYDGAQGRKDRIYLIFADTTSAGICGIGTMVKDDRDSPANRNNSGPSYSRVDRSCWAPQAALHELMHNLGGVQYSAPHSSGGSHCIDEWDVMCYTDVPNYPAMQYLCPDKGTFQNRIDCNNDDYFHPNPAPGSYLDTHWNTADSVFLLSGPAYCPASAQGCRGSVSLSTSHSSVKSKKRVRLSASVSNATARNATVMLRACKGSTCTWESGRDIATLPGSSPSTDWKATGKGKVTFLAQVITPGGAATSNPVTVNVKKPKKR